MENATDFSGQQLQVGDIVVRASYSNMKFHRIVRINRRSISISCGITVHTYPSGRTWTRRTYCTRLQYIDSPEFNNTSPVRVWLNWQTRSCPSLYKIQQ